MDSSGLPTTANADHTRIQSIIISLQNCLREIDDLDLGLATIRVADALAALDGAVARLSSTQSCDSHAHRNGQDVYLTAAGPPPAPD